MSIEIIPAIDILHGKCVRLTQGEYASQKVYNEHPLEVARQFEGAGLKRLHLVDLDGAKEGRVRNWNVLELIVGKTDLVVDFGGGIGTAKDLQIVFLTRAFAGGKHRRRGGKSLREWILLYGLDKFLPAPTRDEK
jgi:phosphoribosylformimino-5-aminoimidazole carboxamide ribotide isomerase